jgi:ligand-binding SRPBCC domain-containing protein
MAPLFQLSTRLLVARDLETTFSFFADAANLQRLTPPWLNFSILSPRPIPMRAGALIDYRLKLRGVPVRWRTEICEWSPPYRFVDRQLHGPYRLWHHTHAFQPVGGGTLVEDTVRYCPIGGRLVHALFVKRDLERIFTYRQEEILRVFGVPAVAPITVTIGPVLI